MDTASQEMPPEESARRLQALLEAMTDAVFVFGPDGRYIDIAPTRPDLLYRSPSEVLGKTLYDIFPPEQADFFVQSVKKTFETGQVTAIEYMLLIKGREVWFETRLSPMRDAQDRITGVLAVARDISESHQAREELRASEERYRRLVELMPYGVAIHQDGILRMVNRAMVKMLGYNSEDEMVGQPAVSFVHPDDRPIAIARVRAMRQEPEDVPATEERLLRRDGTPVPVELSVGSFTLGGKPAVLVIMRDMTSRKRLEEQLRQALKMEAVGRLAGGIAHDFNNLLTAINGYADLLGKEIGPDGPGAKEAGLILRAGQRAASLTQQLLAFSRRQVLEMHVVNLNQVLEELAGMLRRLISEDIELVMDLAPHLGNARLDVGQMEQVIINLAVNARDAMPGGGKLTLETATVELDESYTRHQAEVAPGYYVQLSVSDTGAGIEPEARKHLFEPFFTTKEGGTGLGLAMVYGIVKQFGGHIQVYSEQGRGTTFKVYLPQVQEPAEELVRPAVENWPRGTETVLVVEDNDMVRNLAVRVLSRQGYTVLEAHQGEEALQVAAEYDGTIDLLLTDVVMPRLSGRVLGEIIQKSRPQIHVLFMSGYTDNVIVEHGALEKGMAFIQKPFTPQELAVKVRGVLGG